MGYVVARQPISPSIPAVAAVLLLAVGTLLAATPTLGQTAGPAVALVEFTAPDPYTVDGEDALRATVENKEPFAVSGVIGFYHPDASTDGNRFAQATFEAGPNAEKAVTKVWDGRVFGAPLRGEQTIHAVLRVDALPTPDQDTKTTTVVFRHHAVDAASVEPDTASVAPGATVSQDLRITNTGNTADNLTLSLAEGTAGWTFTLQTLQLLDVTAGEEKTVLLLATAPQNAPPDAEGRVHVTARSASVDDATDTTPSATFQVASVPDFRMTAEPADQIAEAGDRIEFKVRASNTGNQEIQLDVTPVGQDDGLPAVTVGQPTLLLEPGEEKTTTASLTLPDDLHAGNYVMAVAATNESSGLTRSAYATVHIPRLDAFDVTYPDGQADPVEAPPASIAEVAVRIDNNGNAADTYAVAMEDLPDGWAVTTDTDTVRVPAGEHADVTFNVAVPAEADSASHDLVATATQVAGDQTTQTLTITVDVPAVAVATITTGTDRRPIESGDSVEFPLTIRNDGNTEAAFALPEPTVEEADPEPTSWTAQWLDDTAPTLAPGATATRTVKVTAPTGLDDASYAIVRADAAPADGVTASKALTVATPMVDLAVDAIMVPSTIDVGQDSGLLVRVKNVGTADLTEDPVTVIVNATTHGDKTFEETFTFDTLSTSPGDDTIEFDVAWTPEDGGHYTIQAVVDPDDAVAERAGDDVTEQASNNNATIPVFVRVDDVVLVSPSTHHGPPGSRILVDGDDGFRLRNLGNVYANVTMTGLSATQGWDVVPLALHLAIPPGETTNVPLLVDIPAVPGAGQGDVQIELQGDGHEFSSLLIINVDDIAAPSLADVTVTPTTALTGGTVTISANLTDATQVAWADATLTGADGVQTRVPMAPASDGTPTWTGTYVPATPGTYRTTVTAGDAADPSNRASTQHAALTFEVLVDPTPPAIVFTSPTTDEGAIRVAAGVNFTISDAFGLSNVSYAVHVPGSPSDVVANGTIPPGGPYHVPATGLAEQPFVAVVRAENIHGIAGEANRTFRVDETAPSILRVQTTLTNDGRFNVLAQLAPVPDIQAVWIEIESVGGAVQTLTMNATDTAGDHEALVPPTDNVTAWRVLASDVVGNVHVYELSGTPNGATALGSGSSPAPGVLVLLIAGLGAAALVRRR